MGVSPHLPPPTICSEPPSSNSASIITSSMQVIYNVDEREGSAPRDYTDYASSDEEGLQWDRARAVRAWCILHVHLIHRTRTDVISCWVDIEFNLGLTFQTKRQCHVIYSSVYRTEWYITRWSRFPNWEYFWRFTNTLTSHVASWLITWLFYHWSELAVQLLDQAQGVWEFSATSVLGDILNNSSCQKLIKPHCLN